jgi:hypothetical protein
MRRLAKWVLAAMLLVVLLLGSIALALKHWVGTDDFRFRVSQQISAALGVPVVLGGITVDVWPLPAVALTQVQVKSQPPLALGRIEARPTWAALLRGRLEVATLLVREATVPEQAVAAIAAALGKQGKGAAANEKKPRDLAMLPRRLVLDRVTWVNVKGESTTVDATAAIDDDGLPDSASMTVRKGRFEGAKATLQRQPDHWAVRADIASGSIIGKFRLLPADKGAQPVQGEFDTANVEVSELTAPSRTLTGRVDAHTTFRAALSESQPLADSVHTETRFNVRNAVVHGIDLAQAVKTVGMNRGGETRLNTLAGNVTTQGKAIQLNNLVATSGALSANGNVTVAPNRNLNGRVTVSLTADAVGGAVGVPLVVGGTLDSPSVTLSRGALLGAAIGTMVAPGVGTGAGIKLGDKLGDSLKGLFGK